MFETLDPALGGGAIGEIMEKKGGENWPKAGNRGNALAHRRRSKKGGAFEKCRRGGGARQIEGARWTPSRLQPGTFGFQKTRPEECFHDLEGQGGAGGGTPR